MPDPTHKDLWQLVSDAELIADLNAAAAGLSAHTSETLENLCKEAKRRGLRVPEYEGQRLRSEQWAGSLGTLSKSQVPDKDSIDIIIIVGVICIVIGLWFLLVAPSEGGGIANIHRLTLGETFTIVGAIFVSAGWR